jgi:hypothetical protein
VKHLSVSSLKGVRWPWHGTLGILLVAVFWWVNWGTIGLRSHWAFFPLWLGYILTMDALAVYRGMPSMIIGRLRHFILLFILSAPVWWIFEMINHHVHYWIYIPPDSFPPMEYYFWCTVSFSTVIPAVFATVHFLKSFKVFHTHIVAVKTGHTVISRWSFFILGWVMLGIVFIWPRYAMACLWMSLFFILDPVNYWLGNQSILRNTSRRDWRLVILFFTATLLCGFFWEMWNYYSLPKWLYDLPYFNYWHIFEMPAAGYLGYLPFGLELFAIVALVGPVIGIKYLSLDIRDSQNGTS